MLSEGRAGVDNIFSLRNGTLHRRTILVELDRTLWSSTVSHLTLL